MRCLVVSLIWLGWRQWIDLRWVRIPPPPLPVYVHVLQTCSSLFGPFRWDAGFVCPLADIRENPSLLTPVPLCSSGLLWFLLGLQLSRRPGGPAGQDHQETGGPQSPKPGGLCQGERRLRRRIHDQRLPLREGERRHRLRGGVPVPRRGEADRWPRAAGWNGQCDTSEGCLYSEAL